MHDITVYLKFFELIIIMILVVITGFYARSSARVLKQMHKQARLQAFATAVAVESGITALPPPGEVSSAASEAFRRLKDLRETARKLCEEYHVHYHA